MPRRWSFVPLLFCGLLAWCATAHSFAVPASLSGNTVPIPRDMMLEHLGLEIDATPLGSQVDCVNESRQTICGTLFSKSRHHVELVNCHIREAVTGPDGEMQAMNSHVPWQAINVSTLTHFTKFLPQQKKQSQRKLNEEIAHSSVDAIILMIGRRRPVPKPVDTKVGRDSLQAIQELIAIAPRGAEIVIIDEHNRPFQGILSSCDAEGIHLVNCVFTERVPGRNDVMQCKTSYVPFQSFALPSIKSIEVLSPPPQEFVPPGLDDDCKELCLDAFIYEDGRYQERGKPPTRQ